MKKQTPAIAALCWLAGAIGCSRGQPVTTQSMRAATISYAGSSTCGVHDLAISTTGDIWAVCTGWWNGVRHDVYARFTGEGDEVAEFPLADAIHYGIAPFPKGDMFLVNWKTGTGMRIDGTGRVKDTFNVWPGANWPVADPRGNVWVTCKDSRVAIVSGTNDAVQYIPLHLTGTLTSVDMPAFDREGNGWVSMAGSVMEIHWDGTIGRQFSLGDPSGLPRSMAFDRSGFLWGAYFDGITYTLFRLNTTSGEVVKVSDGTRPYFVWTDHHSEHIWIVEDYEGYWTNGLYHVTGPQALTELDSATGRVIVRFPAVTMDWRLVEDAKGRLWSGLWRGLSNFMVITP